MSSVARSLIFISYSTRDAEWMELIRDFLQPLAEAREITTWDSSCIRTGAEWEKEIGEMLGQAVVAVCLVSQQFLRSVPVREMELPRIDLLARKRLLSPICVPISSSTYRVLGLDRYQWARGPEAPLDLLSPAERNRALVEIATKIVEVAARQMADGDSGRCGRRRAS